MHMRWWKKTGAMLGLGLCYAAAEAFGKIPAPYWEINLGICYGFSAAGAALFGIPGGCVSALIGEIAGELFGNGSLEPALILASMCSGLAAGGMYRNTSEPGPFGKEKWKAFILWTLLGQAVGFLGVYAIISSASFAECFWRFFYNSVCAVFAGGLILMALQEGQSSSSSSSSSKAL